MAAFSPRVLFFAYLTILCISFIAPLEPLVGQTLRSFSVNAATIPSELITRDTCSAPPLDDCTFYSTCLEPRFNCGPTGYPIGFGQKFCQKFSDQRGSLSEKGQKWMVTTMHCLQLKLVPELTVSQTCDVLEDKALGSHAGCYLDSGLCSLPPSDWLEIVNIVEFKTLFGSLDAFKSSASTGFGCIKFFAFLVANAVF